MDEIFVLFKSSECISVELAKSFQRIPIETWKYSESKNMRNHTSVPISTEILQESRRILQSLEIRKNLNKLFRIDAILFKCSGISAKSMN